MPDGMKKASSRTVFGARNIAFTSSGLGDIQPSGINSAKGGKPNSVSTRRFTLLTWLPKSLFVQFQRSANIYFLFVSILVIMPFSPTMWSSTVFPFGCVLLWTALKDMYEDLRRKRDDDAENSRMCWRYNSSAKKFEEIQWRNVLCGDLLWTSVDEAFPTDMLLLRAAGGQAFISTVNLDGETNLKERRPPDLCSAVMEHAGPDVPSTEKEMTNQLRLKMAQLALEQGLDIQLDEPKAGLTEMGGQVEMKTASDAVRQTIQQLKVSLPCYMNYEHFLPRGCVLRNTPWIITVAAYVGDETKTRMNVASTDAKISNMQHYLNRCVQGLVFFLVVFCVYGGILAEIHSDDNVAEIVPKLQACLLSGKCPDHTNGKTVQEVVEDDFHHSFIILVLMFVIILYQVVPISLYVVFEMMKILLGLQINFDKQMVDKRDEKGAIARTADLVEELGQCDFIFSDKTGTLTENEMVFARACIQGNDLGDFRGGSPGSPSPGIAETQRILAMSKESDGLAGSSRSVFSAEVRWFFFCLVTCHSAQVDMSEDGKEPHYSGSSPDEVAFLDAAHACGISFQARRRMPGSSGWELQIVGPPGEGPHILTVLCEIPFTSERKRMSIICEHKGEFFCITKGADNIISALCDEPFSEPIAEQLMKYSKQGLRTLAFAAKVVDQQFLEVWQQKLAVASNAPEDREQRLSEVAAEMEHSLLLSGITAIEDRLQAGVPEAITTVKAAGIRFWVLTGDKTETAVEIVRACQLFTEEMTLAYMVNATSEEHTLQLLREAKQKLEGNENGGLIIDGTFTKFALASPECRTQLYVMAAETKACVCCRLSPQQKRKLVELVKEQNATSITLAIGDGANDVSMIQGAHIGIGVRGKEGNQAVQASDIAVSQFRFLVPLLLCHGRRAYRRIALFLCYYIYKHIVLATADVIWAHQFNFRAEIGYPEWLSSAYSVAFTSLPVMVILGFDRDLPDSVAIADPTLYVEGLNRSRFNFKIFTVWMISGVWHGALAWAVPSAILGSRAFSVYWDEWKEKYRVDRSDDFWMASCVSFTLVVFFVDMRLWMVALNKLSVPTIGVLLLSVGAYFIVLFFIGHVYPSMQPEIEGIPSEMMEDEKALFCIFLTPLALLIDLIIYRVAKMLYPSPLDKARQAYASGRSTQGKAKDTQAVKPAQPAW